MRLKHSVLAFSVFLTGCYHDARPSHSDYFHMCIAPNGKEYMVDANTSHCQPGDEAYRCLMLDDNVIDTRGEATCTQRGGRVL
jgi:hypothetical protein